MSNNSPAPGRLDSLKGQRSGLTGAKPTASLKFKPKAVARRSKEERDADAPTIVPESAQAIPKGNSVRGRGSARGRGRGGLNRNAGTHIVSSGPLSSGFISMESKNTPSRSGFSPSPTPEFIKNLRTRSRLNDASPSVSSRASLSSDEEDGFVVDGDTKINMSKEYIFDESQTELFPMRAVRSEHRAYGDATESLKDEDSKDVGSVPTPEPQVKPEQDDEAIPLPKHESKADIDPQGSEQLSKEKSRLASDHKLIYSLLRPSSSLSTTDAEGDVDMESKTDESLNSHDSHNDYFFFQLPKLLPKFHRPGEQNVQNVVDDNEEIEIKDEKKIEQLDDKLNGQVGTLRYHKSGKISMKIGDIVFDVSRGGNSGFLQDVVYIKDQAKPENIEAEDKEEEPEIYHLGQILEKIVVTPKVDGDFM